MALAPDESKVQLISPVISEDSALFDRLTLRLRLTHHSPIEGFFWMHWSNVKYNRRTDYSVNRNRFRTERPQSYPIEWEDITVDLRALAEADRERAVTWQDTLFNFHLTMFLYGNSQDWDNPPTFLEIDSIQLTGAEEFAQGELSPRDIAVEVGPPGTLFAAPDFFSLGAPIGTPDSDVSRGAVGDIDGDGDADLVVAWDRNIDREKQKEQVGWIVASNNGLGRFEPTQEITLSTISTFSRYSIPLIDLRGSDFDGDGLLDLVVNEGRSVEVWYNWGDGFDPILQLSEADCRLRWRWDGGPTRLPRAHRDKLVGNDDYGLALWRMGASGGWTRHSLLDWKALSSHDAIASDFNGDGLLDVAMVAGNSTRRSGAGSVARPAQRHTRPRRLLPPVRRGQSGPHRAMSTAMATPI